MKPLMKWNLAVSVFNALGVWLNTKLNYELQWEKERQKFMESNYSDK